ncbi:MAG: hypothetical protein HDS84_03750, partial [Bacteroidales bacterium]|nr:hypothetical protein [Bacteroidales bacterium]
VARHVPTFADISTRRGTPRPYICRHIYQTWHATSLHLPTFPQTWHATSLQLFISRLAC